MMLKGVAQPKMLNRRRSIKPSCKSCRSFHGKDKIVCAVHPYGPELSHCPDHEPISLWTYAWRVSEKPRGFARAFVSGVTDWSAIAFLVTSCIAASFFIRELMLSNTHNVSEVFRTVKSMAKTSSLVASAYLAVAILGVEWANNAKSFTRLLGVMFAQGIAVLIIR
jgi:hypothetical protein